MPSGWGDFGVVGDGRLPAAEAIRDSRRRTAGLIDDSRLVFDREIR